MKKKKNWGTWPNWGKTHKTCCTLLYFQLMLLVLSPAQCDWPLQHDVRWHFFKVDSVHFFVAAEDCIIFRHTIWFKLLQPKHTTPIQWHVSHPRVTSFSHCVLLQFHRIVKNSYGGLHRLFIPHWQPNMNCSWTTVTLILHP